MALEYRVQERWELHYIDVYATAFLCNLCFYVYQIWKALVSQMLQIICLTRNDIPHVAEVTSIWSLHMKKSTVH